MPRLALITGATSGLGEELCALLSEQDIPLFLTGRDESRLKKIADRYQAQSLALDLGLSRAPLLNWIRENSPDLVINNAGFTPYGPVLMHNSQLQMDILEVNGTAAIEIAIEAARALYIHKQSGIILNVSSAAGEIPFPTMAMYAASKALLTSFSKSFDAEMKPHDIRILAALPGQIATSFAYRASQGQFTQEPSWNVLTSRQVAEQIWKQIQTKKSIQIIDFRTRAALILAKLLPRSLVESFLQKRLSMRYRLSQDIFRP